MYDYIVIGAGLAGLYCSHRLIEKGFRVICFEKRYENGGRALEKKFCGTWVKLGGGVSDPTNTHLSALLNRLGVEKNWFKSQIHDDLMPSDFNMDDAVEKIKKKYAKVCKNLLPNRLNISVKDFLIEQFGEEFAQSYFRYTEFSDYLFQDINDYVLRYSIDDEFRIENDCYSFSYHILEKLLESEVIHEAITKIEKQKVGWLLNNQYLSKNVVVCTNAVHAKKVLGYSFLDQIGHVPFCRMYTNHPESLPFKYGVYKMDNEVDKYIKVNEHIMMSIYTDSDKAEFWKREYKEGRLCATLKEKFPDLPYFDDYIFVFWKYGIHYFKPNQNNRDDPTVMRKNWLLKHMNPEPGIYLAGEYISEKGGWVEGAISSVDLLLDQILFKKTSSKSLVQKLK